MKRMFKTTILVLLTLTIGFACVSCDGNVSEKVHKPKEKSGSSKSGVLYVPVTISGTDIMSDGNVVTVTPSDLSHEKKEALAKKLDSMLKNNATTLEETNLEKSTKKNENIDAIIALLQSETSDGTASTNIGLKNSSEIDLYVRVELCGVTVENTDTMTLSYVEFDVEPIATTTVKDSTGKEVSVTASVKDLLTEPIKFRLYVDSSVTANDVAIYHEGEFLGNYKIKWDSSGKFVQVESKDFSIFAYRILDESNAGAKIESAGGTTYYWKFEEALAEVKNGETVTLLTATDLVTKTLSREVGFVINKNGNDFNATLSAGDGYVLTSSTDAATISFHSISTTREYPIVLNVNDGQSSSGSATINYLATKAENYTSPTRAGYALVGWFTGENEYTTVLDVDGNCLNDVDGYTDASGKWIKFVEEGESVSLYAHWDMLVSNLINSVNIPVSDTKETCPTGPWREESADGKYCYVYKSGSENKLIINASGSILEIDLNVKITEVPGGYSCATAGGGTATFNMSGNELISIEISGDSTTEANGTYADIKLMSEILATNPTFPTSDYAGGGTPYEGSDIPEDTWKNNSQGRLFKSNASGDLIICKSGVDDGLRSTSSDRYFKSGTDYVCENVYGTWTCIMEDDVITSMKFEPTDGSYADDYGGVYKGVEYNELSLQTGASGTDKGYVATGSVALKGYTAPTKSGSILEGWYTEESGETKVINSDGSFVKNVSGFTDATGQWTKNVSDSETLNLYALWTEPLMFTIKDDDVTITLKRNGDVASDVELEYSIDGTSWTSCIIGSSIDASDGDNVYFRAKTIEGGTGKNSFFSGESYNYQFEMTSAGGKVEASGNIMSLLDSTCSATEVPDYCFKSLFAGCEILETAPELPATDLGVSCYEDMFAGCTGLSTLSDGLLPATDLADADYCYAGMFSGCTALTTVPTTLLPSDTLSEGCYSGMFTSCTSLNVTLELSATDLEIDCYKEMFRDCTVLQSAPSLPAENLAQGCYNAMFSGCAGLTSPSTISANTLADNCCEAMFKDCTSLISAPELAAETLVNGCYKDMFNGCTELNSITVGFDDWVAGATDNWLSGVPGAGEFVCPKSLLETRGDDNIPSGWVVYDLLEVDDCLCFKAVDTGSSVKLTSVGSPDSVTLVYSTDDGATWNDYTVGTQITLGNVEDKVYFKAGANKNATFSKDSDNYYRFEMTGNIEASADVVTLINGSYLTDAIPCDGCFCNLFSNCESLTTVPKLAAANLTNYCYYGMFTSCTGLTTIPADMLPATTMASYCYANMFSGCTGITSVPDNFLPATTLAEGCYENMFSGAGLESISATLLPITSLAGADYCYAGMFTSCTSITSIPANMLPAMTLSKGCYSNMFSGCTNLTNTANLPAATLTESCYQEMFKGCAGLTGTTTLSATTMQKSCYQGMFSGCTSLTKVPVDLLKATDLTGADYCYAEMFSDCTGLTSISTSTDVTSEVTLLPATALSVGCYSSMFKGCTSLSYISMISATSSTNLLPATILTDMCYQNLFNGCSAVNSITVRFESCGSATDPLTGWLDGVSSSGTFDCPSYKVDTSGVPSGWDIEFPPIFICDLLAILDDGGTQPTSRDQFGNGALQKSGLVNRDTNTVLWVGKSVNMLYIWVGSNLWNFYKEKWAGPDPANPYGGPSTYIWYDYNKLKKCNVGFTVSPVEKVGYDVDPRGYREMGCTITLYYDYAEDKVTKVVIDNYHDAADGSYDEFLIRGSV